MIASLDCRHATKFAESAAGQLAAKELRYCQPTVTMKLARQSFRHPTPQRTEPRYPTDPKILGNRGRPALGIAAHDSGRRWAAGQTDGQFTRNRQQYRGIHNWQNAGAGAKIVLADATPIRVVVRRLGVMLIVGWPFVRRRGGHRPAAVLATMSVPGCWPG